MVAAAGADPQVAGEALVVEHLLTARALRPEILGELSAARAEGQLEGHQATPCRAAGPGRGREPLAERWAVRCAARAARAKTLRDGRLRQRWARMAAPASETPDAIAPPSRAPRGTRAASSAARAGARHGAERDASGTPSTAMARGKRIGSS